MGIKTREFLGNTYYDNIDNSINEFLSLSQVIAQKIQQGVNNEK
ncbi:hypothetical protein ACXOJ3_03570 [Streptococcus thermophilus]